MNLKYYLRGLGIGIIVTALIMGIAVGGKKESLTNEEIKERARALGMTEESTVLADTLVKQPSNPDGEEAPEGNSMWEEKTAAPESESSSMPISEEIVSPSPESTTTPVPTAAKTPVKEAEEPAASSSIGDEESTGAVAASPEASVVPAQIPTQEQETSEGISQDSEKFVIEIKGGDSSYSVCQKLEDAGLVESASSFDRYLFQNGYDKRINSGIFEIPMGAEPEQIAKILARMK